MEPLVVLFGLFGFSVLFFRYRSGYFVRYSGPCVLWFRFGDFHLLRLGRQAAWLTLGPVIQGVLTISVA
jgi:hypothetical protein